MPPWNRPTMSVVLLLLAFIGIAADCALAGTWTPLANTAPGPVGVMMLLPDGTVLGQDSSISSAWYRLTPDSQGHYVNGTWSVIQPMNDTRKYFASQVLQDGRVFVAGAEYGTGSASAEIYDLTTGQWTMTPAPGHTFRDANVEILPDGRVLIGLVDRAFKSTIIYDPVANTWTNGPSCNGSHDESAWAKLPDNSILMLDQFSTSSERYIPSLNQWIVDATAPVTLYDSFGLETGPCFLLPNGTAIFFGGTGHTAIYTPSGNASPGTWAPGPDLPNSTGMPDAPAAMLPNGRILCAAAPVPTSHNEFNVPTTFCEYDWTTNSFAAIPTPTGGTLNHPCYYGTMLVLPDGTALYSDFSPQVNSYQFDGTPLAAGKPGITGMTQNPDGSYHLTGTQLNGISEGSCYNDENENATNYPIVRIKQQGGDVFYARSYDWSSTGVMTGTTPVSTEFCTPGGLPSGTYSVTVIANGIASDPVPLLIGPDVTTLAPTAVTTTSATLNAILNPNGLTSIASFQIGPGPGYGTNLPVTLTPPDGTMPQNASVTATGLTPHTTYHFRATATNSLGRNNGNDITFATANTPPNAPVLIPGTVFENSPAGTTVGILGPATDPDGDAVTYSLVDGVGSDDNADFFIVGNLLTTLASLDDETVNSYSIRVRASDAFGGTSESALTVTVLNVNDPPTLDAIANPPAIPRNAGTQFASLSGISAGTGENQVLTVTATSNNTALIPNPTVSYTSPNSTGTVAYAPLPNASGSALLTITVHDNGGTANGGVDTISRTFTVTVSPLTIADAWRQASFGTVANTGSAADSTDADHDGIPNLLEFAFGTDPTNGSSGPQSLAYTGTFSGNGVLARPGLPIVSGENNAPGSALRGLFVRRTNYADTGLVYTPQFSADLVKWQNSTDTPTVLSDDGTLQTVSVPFPPPIAGQQAGFFRVQVSTLSFAQLWRRAYFGTVANTGSAADSTDADHDGIPNLLEFAFGTDPTNGSSGPQSLAYTGTFSGNGVLARPGLPIVSGENNAPGSALRGLFVRRTNYADTGLVYTPQFSADLVKWQNSTDTPTVLSDDGTLQTVSVPFPPSIAGQQAGFFRVMITASP